MTASVLSFCLAVTSVLIVFQGTRPLITLSAMVVAVWVVVVTHIDLRCAAIWWGLETSLPYTAAFTEEDQEKYPVP